MEQIFLNAGGGYLVNIGQIIQVIRYDDGGIRIFLVGDKSVYVADSHREYIERCLAFLTIP